MEVYYYVRTSKYTNMFFLYLFPTFRKKWGGGKDVRFVKNYKNQIYK